MKGDSTTHTSNPRYREGYDRVFRNSDNAKPLTNEQESLIEEIATTWINSPNVGRYYEDGEPCSHKGCLNHITHPCECCGRVGGINIKKSDTD